MGQLWTDEMQADLERWQAAEEEAANPKDFLVARDINMNDFLRGFARYTVAVLRYWVFGVSKPLPLRMLVDLANIDRLRDPAQQTECEEWMRANPMQGDPFEGLIFDDD